MYLTIPRTFKRFPKMHCNVCRFVFIPLFLICNVRPDDRGLTDVYMASDVAYIIIMALFR